MINPELSNSAEQATSKKISINKILAAISCAGLLLFCGAVVCPVVGFLAYFSRAPQDITVTYDLPTTVALGESFDLRLYITNTGTTDIYVTDIDLKAMFNPTILEGLQVNGTVPQMGQDVTVPGVTTFPYYRTIPAGETHIVTFHLQAVQTGHFSGPIGVYVNMLGCYVYPNITVTG